mmetsp:Transcript_4650/g.4682  ORF Transcript_4650/g.4682 Transcript_4650/m.4682 type:complete len:474 (+) Transcript_4650:185-1606(+)
MTIIDIIKVISGITFVWIFIYSIAVIRKYRRSFHKTLKNCAIDVALTPLRWFKIGPYSRGEKMIRDINESLTYATKKSGLSDFGGTGFIDAYNKIMKSEVQLNEKYTNLGYIAAKIELGMGWVRRLKLVDYIKKNPDVLQVPVRSPVFVMGLPRTGTTFLHRLLSLDPAVRAPITWELLAPVPTPSGKDSAELHNTDREKRAKYIRKLIATRKSMGDYALERIHEVGWDLPEECLLGLSDEMPLHIQFFHADYINIDKFLELDATDAYAYYKKILQLLSYQIGDRTNPKRWTLKCPVHLFYPKQIAKVFPDAKFIWTHRHPLSAVPSLCSLVQAAHSVYYEPDNLKVDRLGASLNELSRRLVSQTADVLKQTKCESMDVIYDELIKNPKATVQQVYKQFGWTFTPEYEAILDEFIKNDNIKRANLKAKQSSQEKKENLHDYSPETYSLTKEQLCSGDYKTYIDRFKLTPPKEK